MGAVERRQVGHAHVEAAVNEYTEPAFSENLAATIRQYWKIRGKKVAVVVHKEIMPPQKGQSSFSVYAIRSEGIPMGPT